MPDRIRKIEKIPIRDLKDFPGHPFLVRDDESMQALAESIRDYGIITPVTVRVSEDGGYEIISGHRRKRACELAGITAVPAVRIECTKDEAIIMMVDSNFQRENILPSEKAKAYKMKLDAIKRQGKRTDLLKSEHENPTSVQVGQKSVNPTSRDLLSGDFGDSSSQIQRFIRLNELNDRLTEMVDKGRLGLTTAVEISYLPKKEQDLLAETIESEDSAPSLSQAQRMRKMSREGSLNEDSMLAVMTERKKPEEFNVVIPMDRIGKFFPKGLTPREIGDRIVSIIERLYIQKHRQKDCHERDR